MTTGAKDHHRADPFGKSLHKLPLYRPQSWRRSFDKVMFEIDHFHERRKNVPTIVYTATLQSEYDRTLNHANHACLPLIPLPLPLPPCVRYFSGAERSHCVRPQMVAGAAARTNAPRSRLSNAVSRTGHSCSMKSRRKSSSVMGVKGSMLMQWTNSTLSPNLSVSTTP